MKFIFLWNWYNVLKRFDGIGWLGMMSNCNLFYVWCIEKFILNYWLKLGMDLG